MFTQFKRLTWKASLLTTIISLLAFTVALAADGSLDPTFGTDGRVITDFGNGNDYGAAVAIQSDGKIIVGGTSSNGTDDDFALARYNSDGSPDMTFDTDGKVTTDFASGLININTASQAELESLPCIGPTTARKIIEYREQNGSFEVIEEIINVSGIGPGTFECIKDLITVGGNDLGNAVTLQSDGKIIVAGSSFNGSNDDIALARYNSDGSPDTTFDNNGTVTTDFTGFPNSSNAVVLQPDGKIVVAGYSLHSGDTDEDFALVRYNSNGSLDTTFDTDGKVTTDISTHDDSAYAVALQPDGKIVIAGYSFNSGGFDFALVRYNKDGSLDPNFNADGILTTDFGGSVENGSAVALQLDGKIVVAGYSYSWTGFDFALARYNNEGSLDTTFDTDGKVTTDFGSSFDQGHAVALQPEGKIVVSGYTDKGIGFDFALARYNSDGSLDTTFATDGKVTTDFGGTDDNGFAVDLQPDGKLVVAGQSFNGSNFDFALARYDAGTSTAVTIAVPGTANPWLAGMPDGTLSLFGDSAPANSPVQMMGLPLTPGISLFFSATGLISHGPPNDPLIQTSGPDGGTNILSHDFGPENGISDIRAPINALLGVFLGADQPNLSPPPSALDFSTLASRDYLSLSPQLQQVFFIGDGLTSAGQMQEIVIPAGATRLFLGPMDASQYNNNQGSFTVLASNNRAIEVTIDIKPGRFPNRIELEKKVCKDDDNLYVAILTTPTFDAQTVDASSLQLGDPLLSGTASPLRSRIRDVDLDGDKDMALTFRLCKLVSNRALNVRSAELVLTGKTLDDIPITGRDSVKVVREDE